MIVTAFSAKGYREYAHRLMKSTHLLGRQEVIAYSEDMAEGYSFPGVTFRNLGMVPAFTAFLRRHAGDKEMCGRGQPRAGWKEKDRQDGYCFRFDAVKFCRKVFAIADAARTRDNGSMTWLDADAYPIAPLAPGFLDKLVEPDADVAYLGRHRVHSECGFLHFRLPAAMPLIQSWENFYASDRFIQEREYHDSFLFDLARAEVPSVRCRSISTPGMRGHVWFESPLGEVFEHLKGDRKERGYSPERLRRGGQPR